MGDGRLAEGGWPGADRRWWIGVLRAAVCVWLLLSPGRAYAQWSDAASSSLQSYTGIIDMPNARVLPDWRLRLHMSKAAPYWYYGLAIGLWNRLEIHGQFTEVTSIVDQSLGPSYGYYKDRSAGLRYVLLPEGDGLPQVALGVYDVTGSALWSSRYLVASKMWGSLDLTFGLGQGTLAGEFVGGATNAMVGQAPDTGFTFLRSSPVRRTKPFGGLEWHYSRALTFCAEYSSLKPANMFGYRTTAGDKIKDDPSRYPVNLGVKYRLNNLFSAQVFSMGGATVAGGLSMEFPLDPEGMLPWKKLAVAPVGEGDRWQAEHADYEKLAGMIARRIHDEGFRKVAVSCSETGLWIEAENNLHLSPGRALGHIFLTVDPLAPKRITTLYLNLKKDGQVIQSLRASRDTLRAFIDSSQDVGGFRAFSDIDLYGDEHWRQYQQEQGTSALHKASDDRMSYSLNPKVRTFLNNRAGFFKSKGVLQGRADCRLAEHTKLSGEIETSLFNQWDQLVYSPQERDSVRTDIVEYEKKTQTRVSMLALDHVAALPYDVLGRVSAGYFESAYAGLGGECFRYFHDGRWGLGLESETVRKRDLEDNFALRSDLDTWFTTAFVNLYAQLWPSQGLEGGLKIGRFLAGDPGVSLELRRSFRYFTLGVWYTKTDTSQFTSSENRGSDQKGVYISFPLSIFSDHDVKGHMEYDMTSFTKDTGATVRQPSLLYPLDPWSTPAYLRGSLEEMRGM